jgi:hypothetical protein
MKRFKAILPVQSHLKKYSASPQTQISNTSPVVPSRYEGRLAIVTNAGRDAVDALALKDERR